MSDRDPSYCSCCYTAAKKHGRAVRQTDVYKWPICGLCESRIRNGLVRYRPSNGTEMDIFERQCNRCRHGSVHPEHGCMTCAHGILDKLAESGWEDYDTGKSWFMPDELRTHDEQGGLICPADCLKFTHRNDPDGERRDPPPKDCEGQLFFSDILVAEEPARFPAAQEQRA